MDDFSRLVLQASQRFGAPAHVARIVKRSPYEVYRWLAGVTPTQPSERIELEALLRAALHRSASLPQRNRRWGDPQTARA